MNLPLIIFWLSLVAVAVSATWAGYLGRLATEKTIRHAIEHGAPLDAEAIERLKRRPVAHWAPRLMICGLVFAAIGVGIGVFGALLAMQEPESLPALLGVGGFCAAVGLGLIGGALWLRRGGWDHPA
jgi:hypothetical protein